MACVKPWRSILLLLWLGACVASAAEFRTFTSRKGDTMRAKLLRVEGEQAVIEREDGQVFRFELALLDDADVAYARDFATTQIITTDPRFDISMRRSRVGRARLESHPNWRSDLDFRMDEEELIYVITIRNGSSEAVKNFRLQYQVLHQANNHGVQTPRGLMRLKGEEEVAEVPARGEVVIKTKPIRYVAAAQREVYERVRGVYTVRMVKSRDDVIGAWTRIQVGGEVIREDSNPGGLSERFDW